jgi:hypothetical protein
VASDAGRRHPTLRTRTKLLTMPDPYKINLQVSGEMRDAIFRHARLTGETAAQFVRRIVAKELGNQNLASVTARGRPKKPKS